MSDRVLLCGAWDEGAGYPRTRSLRQGLEAAGIEVSECRVPGLGQKKQSVLKQPWRWPYAWWQQKEQRATLLQQLEAKVAEVRPHAVVVPYPGHGLVRAIKERVAAPVAFDMFLSAYDTVVEDRKLARPGSLVANYLQRLDTKACAAADLVVLDTPENASYVQSLTGLSAERFTWLPVHDPYAPQQVAPWQAPADGMLQVLFFGTGVPLHGLKTLIAAVAEVANAKLTLVGAPMRIVASPSCCLANACRSDRRSSNVIACGNCWRAAIWWRACLAAAVRPSASCRSSWCMRWLPVVPCLPQIRRR